MKSIAPVIAALVLFLAGAAASHAAPLKTYVAEFSVSGAANKDELKMTLQGLLSSRLNPEQAQLVESQDKAEVSVAGSYAQFGKIFSLDVLIKNLRNSSLTKVFEQGDSQDDLLPAIGRLSAKIDRVLGKMSAATVPAQATAAPIAAAAPALPTASAAVALPVAVVAKPESAPSASAPQAGYLVAPESKAIAAAPKTVVQQSSYLVKTDEDAREAAGSWTSAPLEGIFTGIAVGRTLPGGEREIFVAADRTIRYYLKGSELKLVAEATIAIPAKILSIDTADLDADGIPELYVTIFDRESLSSRVYRPTASGMEKVAESLPWFFRGIGTDLNTRTIFAQEMLPGGKFYGGPAELVKSGSSFSTKNPRELPRSGFIFNFNMLAGEKGKGYVVVINEDGYLVVTAPNGEEAWKSSDKYGGSESFFKVEALDQRRATGDEFRWTFLEQRIVVTPDGTLLVPHNEGMFNIGNNRSYTKYSVSALTWNGSSLKEKWHTRLAQSYLADFAFDPATKELILLEVVQKSGMFSKGKTVISINKID